MKNIKIFITIFILWLATQNHSYSSAEEGHPKIGFVKNDGANVRAGDNINFESLCKLQEGDPLRITDKRYSWFKIILPKKAHIFIKNDYVDLNPNKETGVVNAVQVNLRAGPGTRYSILGQASSPQELNIISEKDGWYEIEPPDGLAAGWIHSSQVRFSLEGDLPKEEKQKKSTSPERQTGVIINLKSTPKDLTSSGNLTFSGHKN